MWRRPAWLKLRYLPLIVGASLPLISWFYLMWNTTAGEINPSLRFRTKTTIAGVIGEAAPILSLDAVLTGTYQRWVSRSIGQLSPVFKMAVGWKGQIYYSLLGMVPEAGLVGPDSVIVGRDQQLFEMNYLNEYCGRDPAKLQTAAEPGLRGSSACSFSTRAARFSSISSHRPRWHRSRRSFRTATPARAMPEPSREARPVQDKIFDASWGAVRRYRIGDDRRSRDIGVSMFHVAVFTGTRWDPRSGRRR